MRNQNIQDVVTGKVRLSYAHLFTPYTNQLGGEPRYSTTILLPKTDIATKQRIDAGVNAAIQEGISTKWNGVRPPVIAIPVYDGDGVRPSDGMPFGEECKGHWIFTASSKQPPEIVNLSLQRISNAAEIYSGIYARVSVRFFPYATNDKKGIGCGLGPLQKLEDGEPLGGRVSAASAFNDNLGGYSSANSQAPTYIQQPAAYPEQPLNNPNAPVYQPQQTYSQQPIYQKPSYPAQTQPTYPQQPAQIDPITGAPVNGGVMGL